MNESSATTIETPAAKKRSIFQDRNRTNLFKTAEQQTLAWLCERIPAFVTSDMLSVLGFLGSVLVGISFVLAKSNSYYILFGVLGFAIQWFGDSLDGRIAYYRNKPRKWYGFGLDMCIDWFATVVICLGFYFYLPEGYQLLAFTYAASYALLMIVALMKYKISGQYLIDTGLVGPTELRIAICLVFVTELVIPGTLNFFAIAINVILLIIGFLDFRLMLRMGNERDAAEREQRKSELDAIDKNRKVA
ncbi:MAG: hypothetical protein U0T84_07330 [Chitinophagales bacterium]